MKSSGLVKKKYPQKKKTRSSREWIGWILAVIALVTIAAAATGFYFRYDILRILRNQQGSLTNIEESGQITLHGIRNREILADHIDKVFGIDVSHYQEKVDWKQVSWIYDEFPVNFVILRATMGWNGKDATFSSNWSALRNSRMVRGAYHYYRPDEPSVEQAENFIQSVKLVPGDLPPILDIEVLPKVQSMDRLKIGLQNWLNIVERHYGVKPILYSGQHYYEKYLEKEFKDYTVWVANYNHRIRKPKKHWAIWQFTEKGYAKGIKGEVDVNIFNGDLEDFNRLRIKAVRQ